MYPAVHVDDSLGGLMARGGRCGHHNRRLADPSPIADNDRIAGSVVRRCGARAMSLFFCDSPRRRALPHTSPLARRGSHPLGAPPATCGIEGRRSRQYVAGAGRAVVMRSGGVGYGGAPFHFDASAQGNVDDSESLVEDFDKNGCDAEPSPTNRLSSGHRDNRAQRPPSSSYRPTRAIQHGLATVTARQLRDLPDPAPDDDCPHDYLIRLGTHSPR